MPEGRKQASRKLPPQHDMQSPNNACAGFHQLRSSFATAKAGAKQCKGQQWHPVLSTLRKDGVFGDSMHNIMASRVAAVSAANRSVFSPLSSQRYYHNFFSWQLGGICLDLLTSLSNLPHQELVSSELPDKLDQA